MTLRIEELYAYMREREAIRLRRLNGLPSPWTNDPILATWKLTNVHREHDRTSQFLIEKFYKSALQRNARRDEILFNAAVFRYFGTSEFASAVGWNEPCLVSIDEIEWIARDRMIRNERVYTGAYIVTSGARGGPKEQTICRIYLTDLLSKLRYITADDGGSWRVANERLRGVEGFGRFTAKETILDCRYAGYWAPGALTDVNEWCPMGPGARRGAARLANLPEKWSKKGKFRAGINESRALEICKEAYAAYPDHWPVEYGPLELHDVQWSLCEWDKIERVRLGQGQPRSKFRPTVE